MPKPLPKALIAVVSHIELNTSGWRDRTLKELIFATLWLHNRPVTMRELEGSLAADLGVALQPAHFQRAISQAKQSGQVLATVDDCLSLSTTKRAELDRQVAETEALETTVRGKFLRSLPINLTLADPIRLWCLLRDSVLAPSVKELGARTVELLSGAGQFTQPDEAAQAELLSVLGERYDLVLELFNRLLDSGDGDVRRFVVSFLNAFFVVESSALPEASVSAISALSKRPLKMKLVVDTNYLLCLLDLQDHPAIPAISAVDRIRREGHKNVELTYRVHSSTLNELRDLLASRRDALANVRPTPAAARAYLRQEANRYGVDSRYYRAVAESNRTIGADSHFGPPIAGLTQLLSDSGVKLLNLDATAYGVRSDVVDDINLQADFLAKSRRAPQHSQRKLRSYESLKHDIVLWHLVNDKRAQRAGDGGALDVEYWIATVDGVFLGFDSFKARKLHPESVAVCVHPTALLQMMAFWLPRDEGRDLALMASLRLLLDGTGDDSTDRVSQKIMEVIAGYENHERLSESVIASLLVNRALHTALSGPHEEEEERALVREALIQALEEREAVSLATDAALRAAQATARQAAVALEGTQRELAEATAERELASMSAVSWQARAEAAAAQSSDLATKLETASESARRSRKRQRLARRRFIRVRRRRRLRLGAGLVLIGALAAAVSLGVVQALHGMNELAPVDSRLAGVVVVFVGFPLFLVPAELLASRLRIKRPAAAWRSLRRARGILITILLSALGGVATLPFIDWYVAARGRIQALPDAHTNQSVLIPPAAAHADRRAPTAAPTAAEPEDRASPTPSVPATPSSVPAPASNNPP